jgi:CRP-like cAMP-binding protein
VPTPTFYIEDPLFYLPRKPVRRFAKRDVIYDEAGPCNSLYVVIHGRVKLTLKAIDGTKTSRIINADRLFGEAVLIDVQQHSESAVALENVDLMAWPSAEIEAHIEREPRLGVALLQYLVREGIELQERLEALALYKTPERVMLALLQLASAMGSPLPGGITRIDSVPHHTFAEYVGTSRELVTFHLNRLRRLGVLDYSRKVMDVHVPAIEKLLHEQDIALPRRGRGLAFITGA